MTFKPHPALERFTPAELELIVKQAQEKGPGLAGLADRIRTEVEAKLREEGVPEVILQLMRSAQAERAAYRNLARELFPVQQMPEGALPIYDKDPKVSG